MSKSAPSNPTKTAAQIREDRLKSALKANMGKRKAQSRARGAQTPENGGEQTPKQGE